MPTVNNTPIPNMETSWEGYSGEQVEAFIKGQIRESKEDAVKSISVNNEPMEKDTNGNVNIQVDRVQVDDALDSSSEFAVQNKVVNKAITDMEDTIFREIDKVETDDGNLRLSFLNKYGNELTSVEIPKGTEGDIDTSRIYVTAVVNPQRIKQGNTAILTYSYRHGSTELPDDGVAGDLTIRIVNGTTTLYERTLQSVPSDTTDQIDITEYIANVTGNVNISIDATATLSDGTVHTRRAFTTLYVAKLNLTSSFDIAARLVDGGYARGESITFRYYIEGAGTKSIRLYIDGVQYDSATESGSGRNKTFTIDTSSLASGRHNIQVVAECDNIKSQSLYRDFLIQGATVPYIGCAIDFPDGRIYTDTPITPTIDVKQFAQAGIDFVAWNPESNTSSVDVLQAGNVMTTLTANRTLQHYATRFNATGNVQMALQTGVTTYPFYFRVEQTSILAEETGAGLQVKLTATGRSNTEASHANWGGITTFEGVDWQSSGWATRSVLKENGTVDYTYEVMRLINGARATIAAYPFQTDAKAQGMTVEVEYYLSNVSNREGTVLSCVDTYGMGFRVKAQEVQFLTGGTKQVATSETDANGNTIYRERPIGVSMTVASDMLLKVAFVLHTRSTESNTAGNRLMALYINGVLSKVDQYNDSDLFIQDPALPITIDSTHADVDIRCIRIYDRALSSNELLENYIVDRPTMELIQAAYDRNNILDNDGKVSLSQILAKGKGIMVITPQSQVNAANANNSKDDDFPADKVQWYSPFGEQYDFEAQHINFRIQGTSSTKYPRKNYRIYLAKTAAGYAATDSTLIVGKKRSDGTGGTQVSQSLDSKGKIKGNKYALRPNGQPMNLFCMKADFSDSSMTMNTGGAKLFNEIMISLDLLTPPQQYQKENGGTITIRQAIDGIPCDLFVRQDENSTPEYYGQYNLNNEKSKSGELFGMKKFGNFDPACPIAFEALHNKNPFCLFQSNGTANSEALEQQLQQSFDAGFEFNYPEDYYYGEDTRANKIAKGKDAFEPTTEHKAAIHRLMGWLWDVCPANMRTAPQYGDKTGWGRKSDWVSQSFKDTVAQHFDVQHLCTYYLFTDYWASVDQRAKNILWRTWDGWKWYATFYDGDTAMSIRNDGFMAYLYDMTRDTYDDEAKDFAFMGHDSRLWCLVLANLESELQSAANNLRKLLTTKKELDMFNGTQQGNWSEREYNESGWFKYVKPLIEGVPLDQNGATVMQKYDYLYVLTGNREAHRTAFLSNRAALLDAIYGTDGFTSDRIQLYVNKENTTAQDIFIKSGDLYYFGYKTNNGSLQHLTLAQNGETITIPFDSTGNLNDPYNLCGASRIAELDWRNGPTLARNFDVNACAMLQVLNMSAADGGTLHNGANLNGIDSCPLLHTVDITGQTSLSIGGNASIDLSTNTRLATLRAGGTSVTSVTLAEGAPITTLILPATLTSLRLRYLPNLRSMTVEGYDNITQFNFASCPYLDWQQLLSLCTNVQYIRVEGITGRVSPDLLRKYQSYKGIDENGNIDTVRPRLVGKVTLTQVITDEELQQLKDTYTELDITPAQYSEYIFHDLSSDPANVTNMDNLTGYAYRENDNGEDITHPNGYQASGHVALLHELAKPVRGIYQKDPVTQKYEMKVAPLNKENFKKMEDGSDSDLSDTTGDYRDFFLHLPRYHYKGINYYRRATKHFFLSTLENPLPSYTQRLKMTLAEIQAFDPSTPLSPSDPLTPFAPLTPEHSTGMCIATGSNAVGYGVNLATNANHDVYRLPVRGMTLVRFPAIVSDAIGSAFTDEDGNVIAINCLKEVTLDVSTRTQAEVGVILNGLRTDPSTPLTPSNPNPYNAVSGTPTDGDSALTNPLDFNAATEYAYDILRVPEGAAYLYFTASKQTPTTAIAIATDSDQMESLEEWVTHAPELIGLWQATKDNNGNIRSRSPLYKSLNPTLYATLEHADYQSGSTVPALKGNGTNTTSSEWQYDAYGYIDLDAQRTHDNGKEGFPVAPPASLNNTGADLLNLCQLRGPNFHAITYETSKNLANIFMAWFGTRSIEDIVGAGSGSSYSPGHNNRPFNYADSLNGAYSWNTAHTYNNVWGIECFTGAVSEWMEGAAYNVQNLARFIMYHRVAVSGDAINEIFRTTDINGKERQIPLSENVDKSTSNQRLKRTTHGRYCDTLPSSADVDTTYTIFYAAAVRIDRALGIIPVRAGSSGYLVAGVSFLNMYVSSKGDGGASTRLCYTGPYTITDP